MAGRAVVTTDRGNAASYGLGEPKVGHILSAALGRAGREADDAKGEGRVGGSRGDAPLLAPGGHEVES